MDLAPDFIVFTQLYKEIDKEALNFLLVYFLFDSCIFMANICIDILQHLYSEPQRALISLQENKKGLISGGGS